VHLPQLLLPMGEGAALAERAVAVIQEVFTQLRLVLQVQVRVQLLGRELDRRLRVKTLAVSKCEGGILLILWIVNLVHYGGVELRLLPGRGAALKATLLLLLPQVSPSDLTSIVNI